MKVKCFAKLNLTLNVFEKRGQFHPIDSIVTSIDIFDEVEVSLCKSGVRADGAAEAALSVADTLCGQYGCGCNIAVKSGIPLGAGLGGSSAQAAAVAYCLASLNGKSVSDQQVKAACALSGSDVNYMLLGGLCRITGKGDEVKTTARRRRGLFRLDDLFAKAAFRQSVRRVGRACAKAAYCR